MNDLIELRKEELLDINGGIVWVPIIVGALIGVALTQDLDKLAEVAEIGYQKGYDAIKEEE